MSRRRRSIKLKFKRSTIYTFSSVLLLGLAGLMILSFSRQGVVLKKLHTLFNDYFGWGAIGLPFVLITAGLMLTRLRWLIASPNVFVGSAIFLMSLVSVSRSGRLGYAVWENLSYLVSNIGSILILCGFAFIGFVIMFNTSLEDILVFFSKVFSFVKKVFTRRKAAVGMVEAERQGASMEQTVRGSKPETKEQQDLSKKDKSEAGFGVETIGSSKLSTTRQAWQYPPLSLLDDSVGGKADRGDIKKNAQKIEETLESFGITARVAEVNLGPAVTQYALEIALGTKLSKITTLANDLALALAAPTGQIRIEAPIPGRSLVGVEVPNRSPEFVSLRKILMSDEMKKAKSKLAVGLGLDVSGKTVVADIARMPHILIAGSTGSGKSVAINSFIDAILFRATPDEVKFILVDPKRVELTQYNGIPHLLSPVICDPKEVISALKWAIAEMERRYKLFAEVGVRNIDGYNELSGFTAIPFILIVIDELADIMFLAPAEVEDTICRLAQLARATGIHLIISTQRPSVDVITGLIKANIPCRIAFNVSSQIDSRVILDTPGAEKLLGRGDMLYTPPDQAKPTRIQGTYVSDHEIKKLIDQLKKTGVSPVYTEEVREMPVKIGGKTLIRGVEDENEEKDDLFGEVVRLVSNYDHASSSFLQRKLKIGYARAARIMDQLEKTGIVSPADGAKPREVNKEAVIRHISGGGA